MRAQYAVFLGLLGTALASGSAWADTPGPFTDTPTPNTPASGTSLSGNSAAPGVGSAAFSDSRGATRPAKKTGRDPVEGAFRLPRGTILNKKQQAAFDDLKAKYETQLRDATDLLGSKDPKDKSKGLKLNRDTRAAIRKGIKEIVGTSSSGGQQTSSSYGQSSSGQSGGSGSSNYAPQGGYSNNYGPPAGGGYPMMSGGGMSGGMRGGSCRGR